MLPKISGYELIEYINVYDIPVIFLTAKSDVKEKVRGLRSGAEDYMTKPFEIMELLARVENVLRRHNKTASIISFLNICIDIEADVLSHKFYQYWMSDEKNSKQLDYASPSFAAFAGYLGIPAEVLPRLLYILKLE